MHITMIAFGSRGDIQPLIALGVGLEARGHRVRLAVPADFEESVTGRGLEFFAVGGSAGRFFGGPAGVAMRERSRDPEQTLRFFNSFLSVFLRKALLKSWEASQDTDIVLVWPWLRMAPALAERLSKPVVVVSPSPVLYLPTSAYANPFQGPGHRSLGPWTGRYNRSTWRHALPMTRIGQAEVDRWRQETLGLPVLPWDEEMAALRRLPHLFGISPTVHPRPPEWGEHLHVTGYWFLDAPTTYEPPPDLAAFLAAGEAPVAIGFSSQVGRDKARFGRLIIEAVTRARRRAILITGWGGLEDVALPEHVHAVDSVPYDWLLPRIAAMVHQGGAGSTAAALRAGVPGLAIPFGYDQSYWGWRIADLGAGVAPIPAARLTARRLARALVRLSRRPALADRARELAGAIAAEDGVDRAAGVLERLPAATVPIVSS